MDEINCAPWTLVDTTIHLYQLMKIKKNLLHDTNSSEVDKPFKILIKILSAKEYIESNIQNIKALRIDDHVIYYV